MMAEGRGEEEGVSDPPKLDYATPPPPPPDLSNQGPPLGSDSYLSATLWVLNSVGIVCAVTFFTLKSVLSLMGLTPRPLLGWWITYAVFQLIVFILTWRFRKALRGFATLSLALMLISGSELWW